MAKRTKSIEKGQSEQDLQKRHNRRKAWFTSELQRQAVNRYQMALDEAYYDGDQWLDEEAAAVRARGQNPVVYNEIAPTANWFMGTETRTRTDFSITSRTDDSDDAYEDAQVKTKLLKYLDDVNGTVFERSQVFKEQVIAGLGWLDTGVRQNREEEPIYQRGESWRNVLHDSLGQRFDLEDGRYVFRFKEVDFDIAEAMFPDKVDLLQKAVQEADRSSIWDWRNGQPWTGMSGATDGLPLRYQTFDVDAWLANPRDRVLLLECWETAPFRGGSGTGDPVQDVVTMRKRVSVQTEWDVLVEGWSPYRHNRFSLIPQWCYRRAKDGLPYGIVRNLRGPQDMLNKQMSKTAFRLSARTILIETGALNAEVMDKEELRDEASSPDAILEFADGALAGNRVRFENPLPLADADLQLAERNINSIREVSGVTSENRGEQTNVVSKVGIVAKQDQGSITSSPIFDKARLARQLEGDIVLSLVEQYYTEPKVFSIAGEQGRREFVKINQAGPNGSRLNDVTARRAAYVIGEQPWRANLAEAAFETTMDMLGDMAHVAPQVAIALLDLVFEFHPNLPNKQAILQRIRSITGQTDPDGKQTPEQAAQAQQKQQIAQAQFEAQMAELQAKIREAKAKGEKLEAEAMLDRLTAIYESAQAAQVLTQMPGAAPIADVLLRASGFVDQQEPEVIPNPLPGQAGLPGQQPPAQPVQQAAQAVPMLKPIPHRAANVGGLPPATTNRPSMVHLARPAEGAGKTQGIETTRPDGLRNGAMS